MTRRDVAHLLSRLLSNLPPCPRLPQAADKLQPLVQQPLGHGQYLPCASALILVLAVCATTVPLYWCASHSMLRLCSHSAVTSKPCMKSAAVGEDCAQCDPCDEIPLSVQRLTMVTVRPHVPAVTAMPDLLLPQTPVWDGGRSAPLAPPDRLRQPAQHLLVVRSVCLLI